MPAKKIPKKPIAVRTVMEVATPPPKPAPLPVKAPQKAPQKAPKPAPKPRAKPRPAPKKVVRPVQKPKPPAVSPALMRQLEMSIAKIEESRQKQVTTPINDTVKLQIDTAYDANASIYATNLIQCLQSALTLPSVGAVKVELTLRNDGSFVKMRIVDSQSNPNKAFLETHLASMRFPAFSGELKKEKEHAFVITFCNN
ncbi:MAG: hypothetical protein P0S96_00090 [Simkaniaceae bacterium]|nr:hypothetical protein [Candidatus Sacchlamyda saccharinae]